MINRGVRPPSTTTAPTAAPSNGGNLMGRRGPGDAPITLDNYGTWQAPVPDPNYVPVDNNPTGSLLRRMGPGDTGHITPVMIQQAQQQAAAASPGNVAGGGFNTMGKGQGTYGQEQRRRLSRGPRTGLSVTPEMLQRAAMKRLG